MSSQHWRARRRRAKMLAFCARIQRVKYYEVPLTASGLVFTFAADRFGAGKVFVTLPDAQE